MGLLYVFTYNEYVEEVKIRRKRKKKSKVKKHTNIKLGLIQVIVINVSRDKC
jgi:hypothetical protein